MLGSRMLAPEASTNETATATTIKSMSENSTLAGVVWRLNKQMTRLWKLSLEWNGTPDDEAYVALTTDFLPAKLIGSDLTSIVAAWQTGAISKETLFTNLQQGEVVAEDVAFEDEQAKIDDEASLSVTPPDTMNA